MRVNNHVFILSQNLKQKKRAGAQASCSRLTSRASCSTMGWSEATWAASLMLGHFPAESLQTPRADVLGLPWAPEFPGGLCLLGCRQS